MNAVTCPGCGAGASGNYCARCGAALGGAAAACPGCGTPARPGDRYCRECGRPLSAGPRKRVAERLPWIVSAAVLVVFGVGIAILVQRQSAPRPPGGVMTGGIPGAGGGGAGAATPAERTPGMPTAEEIAAMSPREAADRLFDRAMSEEEAGDSESARFFAGMALQAYAGVPPAQADADAIFHIGMLHLLLGDADVARAQGEALLAENPRDLYGLVLAARAARQAGDAGTARARYRELGEAIRAGESPADPRYAPHRAFLEREAERAEAGGTGGAAGS